MRSPCQFISIWEARKQKRCIAQGPEFLWSGRELNLDKETGEKPSNSVARSFKELPGVAQRQFIAGCLLTHFLVQLLNNHPFILKLIVLKRLADVEHSKIEKYMQDARRISHYGNH
jgi:hypothetical protein